MIFFALRMLFAIFKSIKQYWSESSVLMRSTMGLSIQNDFLILKTAGSKNPQFRHRIAGMRQYRVSG